MPITTVFMRSQSEWTTENTPPQKTLRFTFSSKKPYPLLQRVQAAMEDVAVYNLFPNNLTLSHGIKKALAAVPLVLGAFFFSL